MVYMYILYILYIYSLYLAVLMVEKNLNVCFFYRASLFFFSCFAKAVYWGTRAGIHWWPTSGDQNVLQKSGWNQWNTEEKPMFSYYSHNQLTKILAAVMRFVPSTHSTSKTWLVYVLGSLRTTTDFCNHVPSKWLTPQDPSPSLDHARRQQILP